jgi:hypothetical protein
MLVLFFQLENILEFNLFRKVTPFLNFYGLIKNIPV